MPNGKSLLLRMDLTDAGASHNCRFNRKHRIRKGEGRLSVRVDRSTQNYCLDCAAAFIDQAQQRLAALRAEVQVKKSLCVTPGVTLGKFPAESEESAPARVGKGSRR